MQARYKSDEVKEAIFKPYFSFSHVRGKFFFIFVVFLEKLNVSSFLVFLMDFLKVVIYFGRTGSVGCNVEFEIYKNDFGQ